MQQSGWKLIASEHPKKNWLFNLREDPTERNNLAGKQAAKLTEMTAQLVAHHAPMPPPLWPSFLELAVEIDKTLDKKHLPEDEYTYWAN
jgi:uncharacterized sulfatase